MTQDRLFGVPIALWIAFFAFATLMLAVPELDLRISRLFFDPQAGFAINGVWWERLLHRSLNVVVIAVTLTLAIAWWRQRRSAANQGSAHAPKARQIILLLALLVLVPGLVVNQGLKEHLGRARPVDLAEFGGTKSFSPPFVPSDQEGGSFSSGHAAAAFFLVVVAAELASVRSGWFMLAMIYAISISFVRVASGGHFFSDIMTSAFLVWIGYGVLLALWPPSTATADF